MRARKLHIADDLVFPLDAVTQTIGILSVRGAGKSNAAAVVAEKMHDAELPFVVIDPVGAWWGLRSSRDGKGPGLPIPIFGGGHGNVPLEKTGGQLLADLVVEQRLSCVLDVSEFSEGDKIRFLIDFAERLYRRNQDPLHLFLEEADDYIPQRPFREQARLLRAWENIVRRGRARGLGMTMITQRSAAINKNVLTQAETLIVLRTTSPQDRKAIEDWLRFHGQATEVLESLAGLENGEAWVWSPHWLGILRRVRLPLRRTFDSGATPKDVRGRRPPATMADVDLERIRVEMADTIERAKAEDPRELRRRVAALEAELRQAKTARLAEAPPPPAVERVEVPIVTDAQVARLESAIARLENDADKIAQRQQVVVAEVGNLRAALRNGHGRAAEAEEAIRRHATVATARVAKPLAAVAPRRPRAAAEAGDGGLTGTQRRILDIIATLAARGIRQDRESVARWIGIHPNGGRYNHDLAALREARYLESFALTAAGAAVANVNDTGFDALLRAVDGTKARILQTAADAGKPLNKHELADLLEIHPNGGRFNHDLAWLRQMRVIPERGGIELEPGATA